MARALVALTSLLILFAACLLGFTASEASVRATRADADAAFHRKDWRAAQKGFAFVVNRHPADKAAWFKLGLSEHYSGFYTLARESLAKSGTGPMVHYDIACTYARQGNGVAAVRELRIAFKGSPCLAHHALKDPDLTCLAKDPEFNASLVEATSCRQHEK